MQQDDHSQRAERVYTVILQDDSRKVFTDPVAFDAYVREARQQGAAVTFDGPYTVYIRYCA